MPATLKIPRRAFLKQTAGTGFLASLGVLPSLPRVSAAEAALDPATVQFRPEIEPLVRFLEEKPRERVLEELGAKVRKGLSYREVLAALLLAGVRNIQPRPVGFKFHAVLVVNSAHLASLASPEEDRWLPIFWAVDQFKSSQAADVREGDWTLGPVKESELPSSHRARQAFIEAMDNWDESGADRAITALVRTAGAHEIFELLSRYGARDFREIGHKEIYVANSFRTLEAIGWHHAEPVLRSVTYALLDRNGARDNPARADYAADRPYRHNLELSRRIKAGWLDGQPEPNATAELLATVRQGTPKDASTKAVELLNRGVSPDSLFDAFFQTSGELMMRAPGILSLHATTFTNALHYAWRHCSSEETRKLLLLQNASFLPLFRGSPKSGVEIDKLQPLPLEESGPKGIEEIFSTIGTDRLAAARKLLGYLQAHPDPTPVASAARRLIFLKGTNSHDYKYSSAVLEDYHHLEPVWRNRFLAASTFYWKGTDHPDNALVQRIRAALET